MEDSTPDHLTEDVDEPSPKVNPFDNIFTLCFN